MSRLQTGNQDVRGLTAEDLGPLLEAEVTAGAGTLEQKSWCLARPVTLIGFSKHAHIRVEGLGIEAVHAALLNTGDAIVLADMVSRQGVFCGNERVRTRVMRTGEAFRLGECLLRLDVDRAATTGKDLAAGRALRLARTVRLRTVQGAGEEWTVGEVGAVIGSRPGCRVRLDSKEVLPLHALLTRVGGQVLLASLAADKLIRVNDTPTNVSVLQTGDTLTIWPVKLQMALGEAIAPLQESVARVTGLQERQDMASSSGSCPEPLNQWRAQLEQYADGLIRRDAELTQRARQLDDLQEQLVRSEGQIRRRAEELEKALAELQALRRRGAEGG